MTGQSVKHSWMEAWANIVIGYSINFCANLVILPIFGFHITLLNNFYMGLLYTGVSLVRQFWLRRYFNALMVRLHIKEAVNGSR
ncbi:MAG: hypothetical protein KGL39_36195 [Patescibacteria group bacterium]|nr:hypothetical protein [Patescibacteria group bacterium]